MIAWLVLFPAILLAGFARAEVPEFKHGEMACEGDKCVVYKSDLLKHAEVLARASDLVAAQQEEILRLNDKLRSLGASKGCAKLDVLPKNGAKS